MKKLLVLIGLLLASPAFAVDNTVIVTPGTGVTMRSKDVGAGVESMIHILGDTVGNPIYGTAGTANANILTVQGIAAMTPFLTTTTLNAETTKVIGTVRSVGNVGGVFDAIGQNVAAPANWLQIGCQFQTTPTTITAANGSPFQCDNAANALVNVKVSALPAGAATSANQGTTTDVPCTVPTSATACSEIAIAKALTNVANSPTPACAAAPCVTTIGDVGVDVSSGKGTPASAAINVSTATTTQIVALSGSTKIYVTSFDVIAGGTGNITFEYGTGASCGTGTTVLTGAYPLTAQAGISKGSGVGAVLIVPAGNALCVLTSAAVQMSGSVSYQQF